MKDLKKIRSEARRDITELGKKISGFRNQEIPEDKFKHFRLTRGVYGQRQPGVQMIRIKIPHGRLTSSQLARIAGVSNKYATGNLHLTTRQDIQLHYVSLDDSPALWAELEEENITLREACGNTVRNITGSPIAGIDPNEPFDVTPYARAFTEYFLRNPVCQDMGRKFKIAFSSSEEDSAFTYIHDIGFIPVIKEQNGKSVRGFRVLMGGGLGAQAMMAQTVYEFMPDDEILPFTEAVIRVFDRYGERANRNKARMKFLIQKIGIKELLRLAELEKPSLKSKKFSVDTSEIEELNKFPPEPRQTVSIPDTRLKDYNLWLATNVFEQKQRGFCGVFLRVPTGDINYIAALKLADIVRKFAADDIRVTINQGLLLRFVRPESLPSLFLELDKLGLARPGFNSTHDVTTCPGTDTCNLGVTNSMELARVLENVLTGEYEELAGSKDIRIKISGCMNSCGQHMAAQIGFHGSSIKKDGMVAPAMQIVLGGGVDSNGKGYIADKIVKLPTKRIPDALRSLLDDFKENKIPGEPYLTYYRRQGKMYFYHLLKPITEQEITAGEFIDWGHEQAYEQAIGVGECAGIMLDVVSTIIAEAEEKLDYAREELNDLHYADAIYNSYNAFVIGAKALLLSRDIRCNTQAGIIADFNARFVQTGEFSMESDFAELVYRISKNEPGEKFARRYYESAGEFLGSVKEFRDSQKNSGVTTENKTVVASHYKA